MPKIILTGGGTAGHVTPNLALLPYLRRDNWEIHYIGTADGIEKKLLENEKDVTYHTIKAGKMRRYFDLKNLSDPFRVISGISASKKIIRAIKPDVIFSKGGFVSVPVAVASKSCKVPLVIHESDMTPGLANKISNRFAARVCTTFPETAEMLGKKAVLTGTPVRAELMAGSAAKGAEFCGFAEKKPVIMMMGGSQGAVALNNALREALPMLCGYNIIHLCGRGHLDEGLNGLPNYRQYEYISEELPDLMALSDMIISRAGSNSIHEFLALKKPCILIPLPLSASRGDQIVNAESFKKQGFSLVLPQEELTAASLTEKIKELEEKSPELIAAMSASGHTDGIKNVLAAIYSAAGIEKQ